jgi:DNA-binding NarL/FixJ family response regulator
VPKTARILIADDHGLLRRGLRAALADSPHLVVEAEAEDGRTAVELALKLRPDIAILDVSMPQLNGLDATRAITAGSPETRVLVLTAHESEQLVREVLRAGARGYLLKSDAASELIPAIDALLADRPYFTSTVAQVVLEGFLKGGEASVAADAGGVLSPREREIVQLLAEGKSSKEIARTLSIAVTTADTHRSNIMRKMGFESVSDVVRYAIKNRMIDP